MYDYDIDRYRRASKPANSGSHVLCFTWVAPEKVSQLGTNLPPIQTLPLVQSLSDENQIFGEQRGKLLDFPYSEFIRSVIFLLCRY